MTAGGKPGASPVFEDLLHGELLKQMNEQQKIAARAAAAPQPPGPAGTRRR